MKVTLERLPASRVQLDIEIDQERLDSSLDAAYRRLSARARIPGFRPGKAPRVMVERHLGKDRIMSEALDKLIPNVYNEAIESNDVDAIDQPHLDKVELEPPVKLSFIVPVRPTVELGDYRSIRLEEHPVEVTDEMVEEQLLHLRRRHAIHAPVERPAAWNDFLIIDIRGTIDGDDEFLDDEGAELALREGQDLFVPGLAEALLGLQKGDEKTIELEIPAGFRLERARGKTATFVVAVREVKEEQLPDEDDEFAAQVNADEFPTFEALRERIRSDIETSLKSDADERLQSEAVDRLVEGATIDFPNVLVEREIDRMIAEATGNNRQQYMSQLARIGRTEAEFRDTWRPAAEVRVRRGLALSRLAELEQIEVSEGDVEQEIDRLASPMGDESDRLRELFSSSGGVASIHRTLHGRRTLERLVAIVTGNAPELPAPATEGAGHTAGEAPDAAPGEPATETPEEASE